MKNKHHISGVSNRNSYGALPICVLATFVYQGNSLDGLYVFVKFCKL